MHLRVLADGLLPERGGKAPLSWWILPTAALHLLLAEVSAPTGICLGRWFLTCLSLIVLAVSWWTVVGPLLLAPDARPSVPLSMGDSSAVMKSLGLLAAGSMYSRNSPAGWRCSRTTENLVGFAGGVNDLRDLWLCAPPVGSR